MSGYVAALSGIKVVSELAAADPRVVLVSQDFGPLRGFTDRFPERHLDVGISEENLIGVAAGLAHAGKLPFVLGMAPFVTMRGFEQIRDDCAYNRNPVKFISPFSGLEAGPWGATVVPPPPGGPCTPFLLRGSTRRAPEAIGSAPIHPNGAGSGGNHGRIGPEPRSRNRRVVRVRPRRERGPGSVAPDQRSAQVLVQLRDHVERGLLRVRVVGTGLNDDCAACRGTTRCRQARTIERRRRQGPVTARC